LISLCENEKIFKLPSLSLVKAKNKRKEKNPTDRQNALMRIVVSSLSTECDRRESGNYGGGVLGLPQLQLHLFSPSRLFSLLPFGCFNFELYPFILWLFIVSFFGSLSTLWGFTLSPVFLFNVLFW
jgi:hypothetical protein